MQGVVLCPHSEVRFWERALSEVVEALWECQSRDRASGTLRGGGPALGGGRTAGARRGRLRCTEGGGGDSAAELATAWAGWGGAGSGGGERARPPAPRGVPGEFTAGARARSGPRTGGGKNGKEGGGRERGEAGMQCSAPTRAHERRRSRAWE